MYPDQYPERYSLDNLHSIRPGSDGITYIVFRVVNDYGLDVELYFSDDGGLELDEVPYATRH